MDLVQLRCDSTVHDFSQVPSTMSSTTTGGGGRGVHLKMASSLA